MKSIFVDTNILLDVFAKRKPHYLNGMAVWSLIETSEVKGFISAISYNNVYYILNNAENAIVARKSMVIIRDLFTTVPLDEKIINMSIDSDFDDFEDAIQYFSAVRCDSDCIITRNKKDFSRSDVPVLSPGEFLSICEQDSAQ
ncbi:MAG: PIN domain-containing protein [Phycisphaerae bacterium]|nr:PIN domain-containing protein [Phycisphaerae bacterium]